MNKKKISFIEHIPFITFLFGYTACIAYKLISHVTPFYDWDESIYIQVGHEMVSRASAVPLWQGVPWLEKPPLAPLLYGIILHGIPLAPEISTRIFSLILSGIAITLVYLWTSRATKQPGIALLTAVITACNPIFIQRAQTVNTDVFLLIGWIGYLIAFPRFWWSLVALFIGVYSKSLLGFYPAILIVIYEIYQAYRTKKNTALLPKLRMILLQCAIMGIWFVAMTIIYRQQFIQVHFIDHMVRRVTSSIESHFGKRTFYMDMVLLQYGMYTLITLASLILIGYQTLRKQIREADLLWMLFLLPWFIFLNGTKTKIDWYIYPALPQIALLLAYPVSLIKKNQVIYWVSILAISTWILYTTFVTGGFFSHYYSQYDQTYAMARSISSECDSVTVLIDREGRNTFRVLGEMNLLISTSTLYGNHPSLVYYSKKPIHFVYTERDLASRIPSLKPADCIAIGTSDMTLLKSSSFSKIGLFQDWYLLRRGS